MSVAVSSRLFALLPTRATFQPFDLSLNATARPMPDPAPVTIAVEIPTSEKVLSIADFLVSSQKCVCGNGFSYDRTVSLDGPHLGKHLGLLEHCLCGFLLLVRRIAVLAQDAFYQDTELGPDIVTDRPVDRDIPPDHRNQFPGNRFERVIPKNLDGAVVR